MKIEAKKTSELSQTEIEQYGDCYTKVYERPTSSDNFLREYQNTCLGHSIHVLLYNEGNVIVGAYSLVPFLYEVNKEKKLFAYAAGLMIEKEYRGDFGNLYGLVLSLAGFVLSFGIMLFLYGTHAFSVIGISVASRAGLRCPFSKTTS